MNNNQGFYVSVVSTSSRWWPLWRGRNKSLCRNSTPLSGWGQLRLVTHFSNPSVNKIWIYRFSHRFKRGEEEKSKDIEDFYHSIQSLTKEQNFLLGNNFYYLYVFFAKIRSTKCVLMPKTASTRTLSQCKMLNVLIIKAYQIML